MYPMRPFIFKKVINLFRSFDGNLPELLHQLAQFQSGLACTGSGSLVPFFYLSVSVTYEYFVLGIDFFPTKFFIIRK